MARALLPYIFHVWKRVIKDTLVIKADCYIPGIERRISVSDVVICAEGPRAVVVRVAVHKPLRQLRQLVHLALVALDLVKKDLMGQTHRRNTLAPSMRTWMIFVPSVRGAGCR